MYLMHEPEFQSGTFSVRLYGDDIYHFRSQNTSIIMYILIRR